MLQDRMPRKNKFGVLIERLLQTMASGALGPSAFHGAKRTAAIDVFFHFFNRLRRRPYLLRNQSQDVGLIDNPLFSGVVYGSAVHR
jgi:hypothetical protein